jgi:penicillin-binding protein 1C
LNSTRGVPARLPLLAYFTVFFALAALFLRFLPYGDLSRFLSRPVSTRFYDRNGNLVQILALEEGLRREYVSLAEMPAGLAEVFIAAEDERFYRHAGVDFVSLVRAAFQNMKAGRPVSGASTITMQLARIIATDSDGAKRNIVRKIIETFNALRLEARFSKDQILELYLNSVPFGFQTEGIASASRNFFAVEPAMLSPAELFCLAVIPRRPAAYNPVTEREACIAAARQLALRVEKNTLKRPKEPGGGEIAAGSFWASGAPPGIPGEEAWRHIEIRRFEYPREMPHLVRYVAGGFGSGGRWPAQMTLSADAELQHYAENLVAASIHRYASSRLTNGAALVIDNASGEILAWVGSADYYDESAAGQIDGVLTPNQPGSSMKPFLYAFALERGMNPTDVLADIPSNYGTEQIYIPRNFNNRFNGPMLFRVALASSLNIPAVNLLYSLGVRNYTGFLAGLGFDSVRSVEEETGLGIALGDTAVSLVELARAFSVFPRDGMLIPLCVERSTPKEGTQVIAQDTARIICSMLSDRRARVLSFGQGTNFRTPFPAMFKTGTANQFQNIVALGATPRYTAAVWMGNFTGETVIGRTGSSAPAALVRELLVFLQGQSGEAFLEPSAWTKEPVCALSGMRPGPACPSVTEEFVAVREREVCSWHEMRGASTVIYPPEYQGWFFSQTREGMLDYGGAPLEIVTPRENFTYLGTPTGNNSIPAEVIGGSEDELAVNYDGEVFTVSRPFIFYLPYRSGPHVLEVRSGAERRRVEFRVE